MRKLSFQDFAYVFELVDCTLCPVTGLRPQRPRLRSLHLRLEPSRRPPGIGFRRFYRQDLEHGPQQPGDRSEALHSEGWPRGISIEIVFLL